MQVRIQSPITTKNAKIKDYQKHRFLSENHLGISDQMKEKIFTLGAEKQTSGERKLPKMQINKDLVTRKKKNLKNFERAFIIKLSGLLKDLN